MHVKNQRNLLPPSLQSSPEINRRRSWSDDDVKQLRRFAQNKISLKEMAWQFSRSATAVNKALDRFKVRASKPTRPLEELAKVYALSTQTGRPKKRYLKERDAISMPKPAHIQDVVRWLRRMGKNVMMQGVNVNADFFINEKPTAHYNVLMTANKLRIERGLNIFHVVGVTEF